MSRFDRRLRGLTKAVDREFAELVRFFPIVAGNDFQEAGPDLDRAGFEIRCPVKTRANVSDHAGGEGSTIWNLHLQMGEAAIRIDSTRNPIAATLAPGDYLERTETGEWFTVDLIDDKQPGRIILKLAEARPLNWE